MGRARARARPHDVRGPRGRRPRGRGGAARRGPRREGPAHHGAGPGPGPGPYRSAIDRAINKQSIGNHWAIAIQPKKGSIARAI